LDLFSENSGVKTGVFWYKQSAGTQSKWWGSHLLYSV